jgi:hypothetical protein
MVVGEFKVEVVQLTGYEWAGWFEHVGDKRE